MNPNDDPIAKQAQIVYGITNGEVEWTVQHREALRAAMDKKYEAEYPDQIWSDVLKVVCRLMAVMPDWKESKQKPS